MQNMQEFEVAQAATLGCILKENHLIEDINHKEELFTGQFRLLYRAMKELNAEKKPIDMVSLLTKQLKSNFGGVAVIQECQNRAYVKKYDSYLKLVTEQYREREKVAILNHALHEGWELERITSELNALVSHDVNDRRDIKDTLAKMFEEPWKTKEEASRTLKTGIKNVDLLTGGFADGELIVFAGRPGTGKTDTLIKLFLEAHNQGYKSVFFSLEMEEEKITRRLVANLGGRNRNQMKDPNKYFSQAIKDKWPVIIGEASKIDLIVYDKPRQSIEEIKAKVRQERLLNPDDKILVAVDYLTLVTAEGFKHGFEVKMFTYIAEEMKAIAKEFNVVFVALSQLSRDCEKRQDRRPLASDIRESGGIEQVCNTIIGMYRESLYDHNLSPEDDKCMEWILLKVREGSVGTAFIDYNRKTGRMTDYIGKPSYYK